MEKSSEAFPGIYRVDFVSRLSIRAVAGGVLFVVATFFSLMALAAGVGLWSFDLSEIHRLRGGFWTWSFACWVASIFGGSFVAAVTSRSVSRRDGFINGIAVWGGSIVLVSFGVALALGRAIGFMVHEAMPGMFWGIFLGNLIAAGTSLLGGYFGTRSEVRALRGEAGEAPEVRAPQKVA